MVVAHRNTNDASHKKKLKLKLIKKSHLDMVNPKHCHSFKSYTILMWVIFLSKKKKKKIRKEEEEESLEHITLPQ